MTGLSDLSRKKRTELLARIVEEVRGGRRFLIAAHENPEGDAIGSTLALGLALKALNKEALCLNQDPTPEMFSFLPGAGEIVHQAPSGAFDAAFALDCGERVRLGAEFAKVQEIGKIINIDHHISNRYYGDLNLVDPGASSTAEILFDLLRLLPGAMTPEVAENLYTGVLTDTGSFHYSNTSPDTFAVARDCLLAGVDPWRVAQQVYENQPLPRLRLLPLVLATLETAEQGRISWVVVTLEMLNKAGAAVGHTEDFINYPRSLKGTEVALLFRELGGGRYRVSLRSREKVNVAAIAEEFGGGGHAQAAGCTVEGNLEEVRGKLLARLRAVL